MAVRVWGERDFWGEGGMSNLNFVSCGGEYFVVICIQTGEGIEVATVCTRRRDNSSWSWMVVGFFS